VWSVPRLCTAIAWRTLLGAACTLAPRLARAEPGEHFGLRVVGTCPSSEAVEQALAPLLKTELLAAAGAASKVEDRGNHFLVSVRDQTGQYADPARDCAERARVSAVFIALTLNPPQIQRSEPPPNMKQAPHVDALPPTPELSSTPPKTAWARLDLGARFDGTLYSGSSATIASGLELRASLRNQSVGVAVGAAIFAPVVWELSGVLVSAQRFPSHLGLRLHLPVPPLELNLDLGVAAALFTLHALEATGEPLATRVDVGPRIALTTHFETSRGLAPYVGVQVEYFPQAYHIDVEPVGRLGSTPKLWVGLSLGASLALN
jgi:hypothetical protein